MFPLDKELKKGDEGSTASFAQLLRFSAVTTRLIL